MTPSDAGDVVGDVGSDADDIRGDGGDAGDIGGDGVGRLSPSGQTMFTQRPRPVAISLRLSLVLSWRGKEGGGQFLIFCPSFSFDFFSTHLLR